MDVFGLIGNPVGHSLSPPMHEAAYAALDMDARYIALEPAPEDLREAVHGADALGIVGLNVTIPFKESVMSHVDPDPMAERIGAINTVDFSVDPPTGYNTDAAGVVRAFDHHDVHLEDRQAVIVGAGGAGRAIAFALADEGAEVAIANRTVERAVTLAADVPAASGHALDALEDLVQRADLVVNATSVGMEEDRSPVPSASLHAGLTVLDAVYRPVETRLLREAADRGARTIDGGWMLLFQGVAAFERWTGRSAPVEAMNATLRERL